MKRYYNSMIIMAILIALSALILIIKPTPTGFVVYTGGQEYKYDNLNKTWDFSDELSYNSSEIIINNSQASLKPIITIYNWTEEKHHNYNITYALYDPNNEITDLKTNDNNYLKPSDGKITRALYNPSDKMDKVSIKDNSNFEINNKIFDINFNNSIYNNDIVSFYLKSGQASEVYLCEVSTE